MEKGESAISIALMALLVLIVLGIQRRWSGATFTNIASTAENFVLQSTGIRGRIPQRAGYEIVKTYHLGDYSAALYRATPAPLVFASFRFVLYGPGGQSVFSRESVEATTAPWTRLYDFAGRHGLPDLHKRGGPSYQRDLSGDGSPDLVLGQYSGGDHCCTTVTVLELKGGAASVLGAVGGLDGLPFEGLEIRRLDHRPGWQLIAHRPYRTACGAHPDAADMISVYAYVNGKFVDQTGSFPKFIEQVLQANLAKWQREKSPSLHLLQTIAVNYSQIGRPAMATQFFQENLPIFFPQLQANGANPQACTQDVANLIKNISSAKPGA